MAPGHPRPPQSDALARHDALEDPNGGGDVRADGLAVLERVLGRAKGGDGRVRSRGGGVYVGDFAVRGGLCCGVSVPIYLEGWKVLLIPDEL